MKTSIPLARYMSEAPRTIDVNDSVAHAHAMMRDGRFRHLPVTEGGKLVGVVSDGDLLFCETVISGDAAKIAVRDAMRPHPYTVAPEVPLDEVVDEMSRRKIGSTIAIKDGEIVGIFTSIDAQKALADVLKGRVSAG